jgi:hypothetical protein
MPLHLSLMSMKHTCMSSCSVGVGRTEGKLVLTAPLCVRCSSQPDGFEIHCGLWHHGNSHLLLAGHLQRGEGRARYLFGAIVSHAFC